MTRASTAAGAALFLLLIGCGPPIANETAGVPGTTPAPAPGSPTAAATPVATATPPPITATPLPSPTETPNPCDIPVFEREPSEPFELLGIVEVKRRTPAERIEATLESAKTAACRMGGSAIVVLHRASQRQGGIAERPMPRGVLPDADLRAAVIRFR